MKTITFDEALSLLDKAYGIHIPDADHLPETDFHLSLDEDIFLRLEAENEDGLVWNYRFDREHNQTVKVDGDRMTLVVDTDDDEDGGPPEIDIRILVPMPLEIEVLPFIVRKAIEHVRTFIPEVDRVVFWGDGRWAFMTDAHTVPSFDGHDIDTGLLEEAANIFSDGFPHAFQLHPDHV